MTNLASYIAQNRTTQAAFAAEIGVTQATVSKLVSGAARPSLEVAVRIERLTAGAVPASSWVPVSDTSGAEA